MICVEEKNDKKKGKGLEIRVEGTKDLLSLEIAKLVETLVKKDAFFVKPIIVGLAEIIDSEELLNEIKQCVWAKKMVDFLSSKNEKEEKKEKKHETKSASEKENQEEDSLAKSIHDFLSKLLGE